MNSQFSINCKDLSVKSNLESFLVENISFSIKKNSLNLLIGPTGSGKTTILRVIKGIIPYLISYNIQGSISINDEVKTEENFFKQSIEIGYLFQDFDLQFIGSTVEQELIFSLENMGQPRQIIQERLNWFLSKYPFFTKILHRNPHTLSGGELAQVVFISTIINDPEIILLDEPLENLDSKSKEVFIDLLMLYKGKKTILVSTHNIMPFIDLLDKIIVITGTDTPIKEYNSKEEFFNDIEYYPWINLSSLVIDYLLYSR